MTRERLYLYDTTLRDGQQTQGVQFSTDEKRRVAEVLDKLGVDYIEGGWPGAKPHRQRVLRHRAQDPRHDDRLRHDQAGRALGRKRRGAGRGLERRHAGGLPGGQDP